MEDDEILEGYRDGLNDERKEITRSNRSPDYLKRHPNMLGTGAGGFLTTGNPARVSDRATQFLRRQIRFDAA